ncbi:MAG: DUF1697 domain-containing protein [Bacteroidetes bacterium]|nr:MAG: DUF1697 domain-containing protein [Bacteroidota bacterium]
MTTFISILRGINVSGQKKILMADLRALYEKLGFKNIQSYIQSGNVVFNYTEDKSNLAIAEMIEHAIEQEYEFQVPVLVKQADDLISAIKNNPFIDEAEADPSRVAVTFLKSQPTSENLLKLEGVNFPPDRFIIDGLNIYIHCPVSYGNSKISNNFFEKKLKVKATSRNWKTINMLAEMVG